jgi:hypothetical protein
MQQADGLLSLFTQTKEMIMYARICRKCEQRFETQRENTDDAICYRCALDRVSGNFPPEEGEFNTARIISGEMTEQEAQWLQEDLESVDHSREEVAWRRMVDEYDEEDQGGH